jgi:hypothetical protein
MPATQAISTQITVSATSTLNRSSSSTFLMRLQAFIVFINNTHLELPSS